MGRPRINEWDGWQSTATVAPKLEPLFPIDSFVPGSPCPHKKRIARGSDFVCMTCHQSGWDHRSLPGKPVGSQLNPDYVPDTKPTVYVAPPKPGVKPTRKQKRAEAAKKRAGDYPIEPSLN